MAKKIYTCIRLDRGRNISESSLDTPKSFASYGKALMFNREQMTNYLRKEKGYDLAEAEELIDTPNEEGKNEYEMGWVEKIANGYTHHPGVDDDYQPEVSFVVSESELDESPDEPHGKEY